MAAAPTLSELRYRAVLDALDQGFCVIEVELDRNGHGRDYLFLETNPAFERLTGLGQATRRRMREIAPSHEQHWFDRYAEVALTGEVSPAGSKPGRNIWQEGAGSTSSPFE